MDTPLKRSASFLAIAVLRGDNRIECGMGADEHRPVTIEEAISPVPINPSFILDKAKRVEIRSVAAIVDSGRIVARGRSSAQNHWQEAGRRSYKKRVLTIESII